ncbi:MAG: hypothetical protein DRI57_32720 [Deltaproteobacteria bacterium]|nr:MAG: hypothetical protein DRI57_32720 [Deltaproteobacteria bacterium]
MEIEKQECENDPQLQGRTDRCGSDIHLDRNKSAYCFIGEHTGQEERFEDLKNLFALFDEIVQRGIERYYHTLSG